MFCCCQTSVLKDSEFSTDITKSQAFDTRVSYTIYNNFNHDDLYDLIYLGTVPIDYKILVSNFGPPNKFLFYKKPFTHELVWYIKFEDGVICSISTFIVSENNIHNTWRICGNSPKSSKYLANALL